MRAKEKSRYLGGPQLKAWRKGRNWTAEKLAEFAGVSVYAVRSWESGRLGVPRYCERLIEERERFEVLEGVLDNEIRRRLTAPG